MRVMMARAWDLWIIGVAWCFRANGFQLTDCRGQTTGPNKAGNLTILSWHIHYNTNITGQRLFYEAFVRKFRDTLPFPPEDPALVCPFGPNWASSEYPYACSLEPPYEDWGGDHVAFSGDSPWSGPQRAFFVPNKYIDVAWAFATANRFHTDVLRHPNTGCMHDDHSVRAHWVTEDKSRVPKINIKDFPCNMPGTGCNDSLWYGPPSCNCATPLPDDDPAHSCKFCISHGGFVEDLSFTCDDPAVHRLRVFYSRIRHYSGEVDCGNLFLERDVGGGINAPPTVQFSGVEEGSYYTFIMVDPDADLPGNGSWPEVRGPGHHAPVRHWVVGNLDAAALNTGDFSRASTLSKFVGPSPPWGSHRYGQFLFRQPAGKMEMHPTTGAITQWDYKAFLSTYGLAGHLVASNWHIVQHTDAAGSELASDVVV